MEYKYGIIGEMFKGESPTSVFEVGCANGGLLADIGVERVGGLDINATDLNTACELFPGQEKNFINHNFNEPFPLEDNSWDIVIAVGTLMYCFHPIPLVKEMLRVAKDKVIIADYHFEDVDQYGVLGKYEFEGRTEIAIARNYRELFKEIGVTVEIIQTVWGKWIIKT